jgi:hypothetical protein
MRYMISFMVAGVASLVLAACGTTTTIPVNTQPTKVALEWDDSVFARFASVYKEEITALVQKLAAQEDDVLSAVVDGQPITTANITTTNFAASLSSKEVEKEEEPETKQAIAAGLVANLVAHKAQIVPGSGQLQGLELAANTPGVTRIYQWTDAVVNEPSNHFYLTNASENQVTAEINYWKPRLRGLKGKTVILVGVGHGVHRVVTVERAHRLFYALVHGNGGHLIWTPTLGQQEI